MREHKAFSVVGVIHLPALPGAPRCSAPFSKIIDHALRDAEALVNGGLGSCIVENLGDAPFRRGRVKPHVPAMLAVIGAEISSRWGEDLKIGLNVLRNDGHSAIGAATACGAQFVRINVLTGSAWTDQGLIEGEAASLLRYRESLGSSVQIMADVCVKHAVPAGESDIVRVAVDTVDRGGADGVIVTGNGTGLPTRMSDLTAVCSALPNHPVWVGSGVTPESLSEIQQNADGVIVGTHLHHDGDLRSPIDEDRVRSIMGALRS